MSFPLMPSPPTGLSGGPVLTYIGTTADTVGATTFTFTAHAIGTAAANRFVIVCAAGANITTTSTVDSCTIGGNAATLIARTVLSDDLAVGMFGLLVPAGTTATITVTYSRSHSRSSISVYTMTGAESTTPRSSGAANSVATSQTLNLATPYAAATLACMYCHDTGARSHTLSGTAGVTNDASVRYATDFVVTVGDGPVEDLQATLSTIATISSTSRQLALVAATFL